MKYLILIFFCNILFLQVNAQDSPFEKVSKQYSLDVGYTRLTPHKSDLGSLSGAHFEFDYAWKLSGYHKKKNTYISVPIGYEIYSSDSQSNMNILFYGWTVRHELRKDKRWTPYVSYGLLLNQVWVEDISGNDMGHETRFSLGLNGKMTSKSKMSVALNYSFLRIPFPGKEKAAKFSKVSLLVGVRLY